MAVLAVAAFIAVAVASAVLDWLGKRASSGEPPFQKNPSHWIGRMVIWSVPLAYAVCMAGFLAGSPWSAYAVAGALGLSVGSIPASFGIFRTHSKLEGLVDSWWRKEIGEVALRQSLVDSQITPKVYLVMRRDLRRRFGDPFMQSFEARFGFEQPDIAIAGQATQ